jgi:SAM-dependent methyltransferase
VTAVIWHDLECGSYGEDLGLWRALADRQSGAVLDIGAGTGRVTLPLARAGHAVLAIDLDDELLGALRDRAGDLQVRTIVADARSFGIGEEFGLAIVPMQTVQLLGGADGRAAFMESVRLHLAPRAILAVAIAEQLERFEVIEGAPGPTPDVREIDGVVYCSRPVAVRRAGDGYELERRREIVHRDGRMERERNVIHLDALDAPTLEAEATEAAFTPVGRQPIGATDDYVGSTVVLLRA